MKVTLITCFHNSAGLLDEYFTGLAALDTSTCEVDAVFVDNASTDDTPAKLAALSRQLAFPSRIVREETPGLMHARCRGADEATGDWILFLDDDNEPAPDFLVRLRELVARFPQAVIFTGNAVLPEGYQIDPDLVLAARLMAVRKVPGEREFAMSTYAPQPFPWGAGLVTRRDRLVESCRAWRTGDKAIVGRTKTNPIGGEEIWLTHHMTRNGGTVVFSDKLCLTHKIEPDRFRLDYLTRLAFESGKIEPQVLDAIREFKPQIRSPYLRGKWGVIVGFGKLTLYFVRFLRDSTRSRFVLVVMRLGLLHSLMNRVAGSRSDRRQ